MSGGSQQACTKIVIVLQEEHSFLDVASFDVGLIKIINQSVKILLY